MKKKEKPNANVPDSHRPTGARSSNLFSLSPLIIFLLAGIQLFLFRPYFDLNDDTFKVFFTQGVGTDFTPNEFMGYSNPLLGFLLKTLFTFFPRVPWYGIFLLSIQFLSLGALLYALQLGAHPLRKALFFTGLFFCVYSHLFSDVQFTVTSILAVQCALFLLLGAWKAGLARHRGALWFSLFLFFAGFLVRSDGFFITIAAALPLLAFSWVESPSPHRRSWLSQKPFLATLSLLLFSAFLFQHFWYERTQAWRDFDKFDKVRVELQDYRIDPYNEQTKPYFDEAGWSLNDYQMFKGWYFMDKKIYDTGRMNQLADHFSRIGITRKPASYHSLRDLFRDFWPEKILVYFLSLLLLIRGRSQSFLAFQLLWLTLIFIFLIYFMRAPERVVLPLLLIPLNAALFHLTPEGISKRLSGVVNVFLFLLLILGLLTFRLSFQQNQKTQAVEKNLHESIHALNPQDNQLFIVWDSAFPYETFNALDNFDLFRKFHIFELAVYQRSPNAQITLDRFKIAEPLRDMVDRPDIFMICTPREGAMYYTYMMEKYHKAIYPEQVFRCAFFTVFRIHSKPVKAKPKIPAA